MSEDSIEIDVQSVKQLLDAGDILLIDCREPDEYETAKIDGAVLMPMSQWADVSGQLGQHEGKRVVVHCHHGGRSLRVTHWLRENGFPEAQNMTGGIDVWSQTIDTDIPRY